MDETSGSTVADESGNGNNGTWTDATDNAITTESVTGQVNTALDFETTDDSLVTVTAAASINDTAAQTVCVWFNTESFGSGYNGIIDKADNSDIGWNVYYNGPNERIGYYTRRGGYIELANGSMIAGTWQHFCGTWDGTDGYGGMDIYLDGVAQYEQYTGDTTGSTMSDASSDLIFGGSNQDGPVFDGILDHIMIFNRELSAAEVLNLYTSQFANINTDEGAVVYNESENVLQYCDGTDWIAMTGQASEPVSSTDIIAHWRLDETSGTSALDSVGGNHGTMANGMNATDDSVTGQLEGGLDFVDADDHYIDIPENTALNDLFAGGGTITLWVNPRSAGSFNGGGFAGKTSNSGTVPEGWDFGFNSSSRRILFRQSWDSGNGRHEYRTTNGIPTGTWTHIAITFNADSHTNSPVFYVDGSSVASSLYNDIGTNGAISSDAAVDLYLGTGAADHELDDIRIYDRVLTASEISDIYNFNGTTSGTNGATCTAGEEGDTRYNDAQHVPEFCNGDYWVAMVSQAGSGGAGCSGGGEEGEILYNSDHNVMQYCDGTDWIGIGKDS